jgi:hypothetical protein
MGRCAATDDDVGSRQSIRLPRSGCASRMVEALVSIFARKRRLTDSFYFCSKFRRFFTMTEILGATLQGVVLRFRPVGDAAP